MTETTNQAFKAARPNCIVTALSQSIHPETQEKHIRYTGVGPNPEFPSRTYYLSATVTDDDEDLDLSITEQTNRFNQSQPMTVISDMFEDDNILVRMRAYSGVDVILKIAGISADSHSYENVVIVLKDALRSDVDPMKGRRSNALFTVISGLLCPDIKLSAARDLDENSALGQKCLGLTVTIMAEVLKYRKFTYGQEIGRPDKLSH